MPRFSVVIPTQARADTLIYALKTAVQLEYDDLEILIHESGDDNKTAEVVATLGDHRTRHVKTIRPVSMTENWERALACTTGEYVTFIGDDDGIVPDACAVATTILNQHPSELLSWRPACYFWPKYVAAAKRNRLFLNLDQPNTVEVKKSCRALEMLYLFQIDYSHLPMIYNSFVSRGLIEKVRMRLGRYFLGSAPDVTSGIVNAFFSESFLLAGRPFSCSGLSHNSTGHGIYFSQDASLRDSATKAFDPTGNTAAPARNLKLFIGGEMLAVKKILFPESQPDFNHRNMLWSAVQWLSEAGGDASTLAEVRSAAETHKISVEEWIGAPPSATSVCPAGIRATSSQGVSVDIDCSLVGIQDVYQATRLVGALLPRIDSLTFVQEQEVTTSIPTDCCTVLRFHCGGNGLSFLRYGWSECEDWGVWSLGTHAEIALAFSERPVHAVEIKICGRMLLHARRLSARGTMLCGGRRVASFTSTCENSDVSILYNAPPEEVINSELVLVIETEDPRSPAEDGISGDSRRIGFGLEEIKITWREP